MGLSESNAYRQLTIAWVDGRTKYNRCMSRKWMSLLAILVLAMAVLGALPSPIEPVAFSPSSSPELVGPLEPNELLASAELLRKGRLAGPEDVDIDDFGRIYCGVEDGTIERLEPSDGGYRIETFASTGGRPLGLDTDASGLLWVADSERGLLSVDRLGTVAVRAQEAAGIPFGFADDVAVASNGKVYFSDASTRYGPSEMVYEALEARPYGRLLEYDPITDQTRVVLDSLYFANGVAVAPDDSYVLVAETFRYRIQRLWLKGPKTGQAEIFADNLPGFPDGVSATDRGTFWVALYDLRSPLLDRYVHPRPWLKRLLAKLPRALLAKKPRYGLVLEVDRAGRILRSLHDPTGKHLAAITSVEEHDGHLYLGTVKGDAIGRYRLP